MVLFVLIAMVVIIIWLLSLTFAERIGNFFINKVINKIKNILK
jgi:hypothetical protein